MGEVQMVSSSEAYSDRSYSKLNAKNAKARKLVFPVAIVLICLPFLDFESLFALCGLILSAYLLHMK